MGRAIALREDFDGVTLRRLAKGSKLNDAQRQALARIVESGPIPAIHGVARWRGKDLAHWIFEEFCISLEVSGVGRELRALGFRKISAYIFSAICPGRSVGAGLALPRCNTEAMQWHLDEISSQVAPGAHAVLVVDRTGWAHHEQAQGAVKHHPTALAAKGAGAEPGGKHMAVHAR